MLYTLNDLYNAIIAGNERKVRTITRQCNTEFKQNIEAINPLYVALSSRRWLIAQLLIEEGFSVTDYDYGNFGNLLSFATYVGHIEICKLLIDAKISIEYLETYDGPTKENETINQIILKNLIRRINSATTELDMSTIYRLHDVLHDLLYLYIKEKNTQMLEFLLDFGKAQGLNLIYETSRTIHRSESISLLQHAILHKDVESAKLLIDKGVNINYLNSSSQIAFGIALDTDLVEVAKYILRQKKFMQNIYYNDESGEAQTPLIHAVELDNIEIFDELLDIGVCIDLTDEAGNSALMVAAMRGKDQIAKYLLDKGINPNIQSVPEENDNSEFALSIAVCTGDFNMLKTIAQYPNVDINLTNNLGQTALYLAIRANRVDMVNELLANGANPNIVYNSSTTEIISADSPKTTATIVAAGLYKPIIVLLLLEAGANPYIIDDDLNSVISYMIRRNNIYIVDLLCKRAILDFNSSDSNREIMQMLVQGFQESVFVGDTIIFEKIFTVMQQLDFNKYSNNTFNNLLGNTILKSMENRTFKIALLIVSYLGEINEHEFLSIMTTYTKEVSNLFAVSELSIINQILDKVAFGKIVFRLCENNTSLTNEQIQTLQNNRITCLQVIFELQKILHRPKVLKNLLLLATKYIAVLRQALPHNDYVAMKQQIMQANSYYIQIFDKIEGDLNLLEQVISRNNLPVTPSMLYSYLDSSISDSKVSELSNDIEPLIKRRRIERGNTPP